MATRRVTRDSRSIRFFRLRYLQVFLLIALVSLPGCFNNQVSVTVGLNETFTINVGKSAEITGEDLIIKFDEVIGDSRCPQNVNCVWAGIASIQVTITYQDDSYSLALNQPGLTDQAKANFMAYTLTYNLNPYPVAGQEITPGAYRLTATITR